MQILGIWDRGFSLIYVDLFFYVDLKLLNDPRFQCSLVYDFDVLMVNITTYELNHY